MTRSGIISVQLDRELRAAIEVRRKQMKDELGRDVRDAEIVRVLLRLGLGQEGSLERVGYVEGWRSGAADAREAYARGVDGARRAAAGTARLPD